jgi:hypothetical protein
MHDRQGLDPEQTIIVNRAPVLTLWASVVAEWLGYRRAEALSLGKAVAGLYAQLKGRQLGLLQPRPKPSEPSAPKPPATPTVELLSRPIPVMQTREGVRAMVKGQPSHPSTVERYLQRASGARLVSARQAMAELAAAYAPEELQPVAYQLYERFRPEIPAGTRGWGVKGALDFRHIRSLGKR